MKLVGAVLSLALAAAFAPQAARAEDFAGDVPDRVWVDLGGQINDLRTEAAATGAAGVGTSINFEDIFNLPGDKWTVRMLGTARISKKRRWIDFGYVLINRSGSRIIQDDVVWGDYTFTAGGRVTGKFNTAFLYTAFRYDFLHEEKVRISGSAGLSFAKITMGLSGSGNVVGPGGPIAGSFEKDNSVTAPVPMVGLNLDWALTRRLVLRTYTRFFKLNFDGNKGGQYDNGIHLNWYFVKNFGMGIGYDKTELRADRINLAGDVVGKFDYVLTGVGLYANLAF